MRQFMWGKVIWVAFIGMTLFFGAQVSANTKVLMGAGKSDLTQDAKDLLETFQKAGINAEKGLWEWTAVYPSPLTSEMFEKEKEKFQNTFSLEPKDTIISPDGRLEYRDLLSQGEEFQLSLRLLGIPVGNRAYETHLIVKLESTSLDLDSLQTQIEYIQKSLRNHAMNPTFYTCLKGISNDKLSQVYNQLNQALHTYGKGKMAETYQDHTSIGFRHTGYFDVQVLIHWSDSLQKTIVTMGTPLIVTEF